MLESDHKMGDKKPNPSKSQFLPVVSLFSGAGGLDEGFVQAGFLPVLAVDINQAACETFQRNHPNARVIRKDLSKTVNGFVTERLSELPSPVWPVGVIGGPPCQAFSASNVHKRSDDPRLKLPARYAHVLTDLNNHFGLDFFVFENVLGLKHKAHSKLFDNLRKSLISAGFSIFEHELNAQDFGVPQVRKRVFVVGFNRRKYGALKFEFPKGNAVHRTTVGETIFNLPPPTFFKRGMRSEDVPFHPNHWCPQPKSKKFFNGFLKEGDIKGRPFRVLDWDKASWTVAYGHREVHIHPSGKRRLSVYEAMLLQGFRSDYVLKGNLSDQIRLVSDAVPPPLARALAESILEVLGAGKQKKEMSKLPAAS